jgi:hypothetical protein
MLAVVLLGCASLSGGGGKGDVTELHLFGLPITVNLDGKPGADGFAVRIYANKNGEAKGSHISAGTLEVLMFDGVVGANEFLQQKPQQTWRFSPREMSRFEEQTSLGRGYKVALRWQQMPKRNHITVLARYLPPKGEPIYSTPSTISAAVSK